LPGTGPHDRDRSRGLCSSSFAIPRTPTGLAAFLTSVGRRAVVGAPDRVDIDETADDTQHLELELYLRVWSVLYPDADVQLAVA
jgi:hypothetical protein